MTPGAAVSEVRGDAPAGSGGAVREGFPEVVRLEPRPGTTPDSAPTVRIFLGTEPAQRAAERIFLYSIERVRNPARRYEIHLMKDLPGFRRRGWRTGFTNYRFAIPTFAGETGKAIYNDVDQVYLRDPAELFDIDLGGHGYLSVSADDTSVMLIDCARMAQVWNQTAAQRRHKHRLLRAASRTGLWGALDGGWNARDLEYVEGRSALLHFTALHLQPWQPTPEQYSYHPHPLGEVWYRLRRAADADGYQLPGTASSTTAQRSPNPEVWLLLEGDDIADAAGRQLAESLGWPWAEHAHAIDPRPGPLPAVAERPVHLLLSAGPRGARAALALRSRLGGRVRLLHLGAPETPFGEFDLILRRPQDPLPLRPNVLALPREPCPFDSRLLETATAWLAPRIAPLPRPWIGVLAGGGGLDPASARQLGHLAAARARAVQGSLMLAVHPDCPTAVAAALAQGAGRPLLSRAVADAALLPYVGCAALADELLVSADAPLNLAAACAGDRPVSALEVAGAAERRSRGSRLLRRVLGDSTRRASYRGTPRQQDWRGRLVDGLMVRGWLDAGTDPAGVLQNCLLQGLARPATGGDHPVQAPRPPAVDQWIREDVRPLLEALLK